MGKVCNILQTKSNNIISITPETVVFEALEIMVKNNVSALLVMDDQSLIGIFTERDYARKVVLKGKTSKATLIAEIMTEDPITITPDHSVEDCMRVMTNRFIRHLPVVEGGKVVGIVSIGDLVKFIIEEQKFIIENLEHYITGT
jgi:CBS domain-containing protein